MSTSSRAYVCEKEVVGEELGETISALPKRRQGELLTIDRDSIFEEYGKFGKGMYLYIFYCLCFFK